jgi:hypothetical protein
LQAKKVVTYAAFQELLKLRGSNGGKSKYGDSPSIVNKYSKMGYKYITRGVLKYMLAENLKCPVVSVNIDITTTRQSGSTSWIISSLTGDKGTCTGPTEIIVQDNNHNSVSSGITNIGRPRGTSEESKKEERNCTNDALIEASKRLCCAV